MKKKVNKIFTKQSNGKLNEPHSHGLIPGVDAAQGEQHWTNFTGRMNENEQWKNADIPNEIIAFQFTVTSGCCYIAI